MKAALILLATLALAAGEGVGHNQVLNFPTGDNTANFVRFETDLEETSAFSVCAWMRKTTSDEKRYWFSYAVSGSYNEIILGEYGASTVVFYIRNSKLFTDAGAWPINVWTHVCATWDASTGAVIFVNGEIAASEEGFKAGETIAAGGTLVIGQEQDSVGGGFDGSQSYQGDVYDLNMWNYALSEEEVDFLFSSGRCAYAETEADPVIPYPVVFGQEPQGAAQFVDGSCMDLDDPSVGKVLRFPPQSDANTRNYVQFTADFGVDVLDGMSVCTWYFKSFSDEGRYVISYAISGDDNAFILGESSRGVLGIWVRRDKFETDVVLEQQTWYHICASWSSESGISAYVDGELVGTVAEGIDTTIPSGGIMTIGQEQDSLGGSFDRNQAFAGSIYNMNFFNGPLTEEEVAAVYAEGTFCEMIPEQFWTDDRVAISYKTISNMVVSGEAVFESGEESWRHGAMHCAKVDIDTDGHNEECWQIQEGKRIKDKSSVGNVIVMDLETAQAACFATQTCRALSCEEKDDGLKCEMKSSFNRVKKSGKHTSYTYVC